MGIRAMNDEHTKPERCLLTVADVMKQIPSSWRGARITLASTEGVSFTVKRVSLHKNDDGKQVVVLATSEMKVTGDL